MPDFNTLRNEFIQSELRKGNLHPDPLFQFKIWLNDAIKHKIKDANAMVLSTSAQQGRPSSRMVLLKQVDQSGFGFFTNYESRKAAELSANPHAALLFYWPLLERQVHIEGRVSKSSQRESDEYFAIRPEGSKIGAWTSPQSKQIPNREHIENLHKLFADKFRDTETVRPNNWGGYRLTPLRYEFWQGRENRLHDRFEYVWKEGEWEIARLAP